LTAPLAAFVATTGRRADRARTPERSGRARQRSTGAEAQRRTAKRDYFGSQCKADPEGDAAENSRGAAVARQARLPFQSPSQEGRQARLLVDGVAVSD